MRKAALFACILVLSGCAPTVESTKQRVGVGTIIIGSAISFTGKYSTNGIHTSNGYNLALKRINQMGGVKVGKKFYKLVIKYYDDESTPAVAAQMAEHLIKRDGVKFMLGPYSSGITMAVSPVTERHRVPLVDAEANARSLFTRGYPQKTKLVYCKDTNPAWRSSGADHGHAPSESPCARCVGTSCGGTDSVFMPLWHTSRTASGSTMT